MVPMTFGPRWDQRERSAILRVRLLGEPVTSVAKDWGLSEGRAD